MQYRSIPGSPLAQRFAATVALVAAVAPGAARATVWYPDCDGDSHYQSAGVEAPDEAGADAMSSCPGGQSPEGGWSTSIGADCNDDPSQQVLNGVSYTGLDFSPSVPDDFGSPYCGDGLDHDCDGAEGGSGGDDDGDGLSYATEVGNFYFDPSSGEFPDCDPDLDDDTLTDHEEFVLVGSDAENADTDDDNVPDGVEVGGNAAAPLDTDGDTLFDALDVDDDDDGIATIDEDWDSPGNPFGSDSDGDFVPDFRESDDDGDSVPTADEDVGNGSSGGSDLSGPDGNWFNDDRDGDSLPNYRDADDDGDGVPTASEDANGDGDPTNDDADGDGVADYLEVGRPIVWLAVGNLGNPDDDTGYGAVASAYEISAHEVTNHQYLAMLNAKAGVSDPYGLWNAGMAGASGGINRSGPAGAFVYETVPGRTHRPVNFVSFYDALRYANWLQNGMGNGDTETGAYTLQGGTPIPGNGATVEREPTASFAVTTGDEWYKAAYYDPFGQVYHDYPTGTDTQTTCSAPTAVPNRANCGGAVGGLAFTGAYPFSTSSVGAFDQGGSVWEWTEENAGGGDREIQGGAFDQFALSMEAGGGVPAAASDETADVGFRLVRLPEPGAGTALPAGLGALALLARRKRRVNTHVSGGG